MANEEGQLFKMNGEDVFGVSTGKFTGRSPKDKWIVREIGTESESQIWWGDVNQPTTSVVFEDLLEKALVHFNSLEEAFVFDGFTGSSP